MAPLIQTICCIAVENLLRTFFREFLRTFNLILEGGVEGSIKNHFILEGKNGSSMALLCLAPLFLKLKLS